VCAPMPRYCAVNSFLRKGPVNIKIKGRVKLFQYAMQMIMGRGDIVPTHC
jgi:hypothetical protein